MTIQETIEKAIDGGWNPEGHRFTSESYDGIAGFGGWQYRASIFLDPLFWQSLGKAMEWDSKQFHSEDEKCSHGAHCGGHYRGHGRMWLEEWHRFIDHLAEGGTPESFFKQL